MIKKSLKNAIGVSIGVTIGQVIIHEFMFKKFFNSYPPLWIYSIICFTSCFVVGFLTGLFIYWIESKFKKEN